MEIVRSQEAEKTTLTLIGRLDTTTSSELQEVLIPAFDEVIDGAIDEAIDGAAIGAVKEIKLDCAKLIYVSSAGLRVLLMGEKMAKAKGAKLTIANVSDEIMDVFKMTGFDGILNIV